jgi:hypothetical protein
VLKQASPGTPRRVARATRAPATRLPRLQNSARTLRPPSVPPWQLHPPSGRNAPTRSRPPQGPEARGRSGHGLPRAIDQPAMAGCQITRVRLRLRVRVRRLRRRPRTLKRSPRHYHHAVSLGPDPCRFLTLQLTASMSHLSSATARQDGSPNQRAWRLDAVRSRLKAARCA